MSNPLCCAAFCILQNTYLTWSSKQKLSLFKGEKNAKGRESCITEGPSEKKKKRRRDSKTMCGTQGGKKIYIYTHRNWELKSPLVISPSWPPFGGVQAWESVWNRNHLTCPPGTDLRPIRIPHAKVCKLSSPGPCNTPGRSDQAGVYV